MKKLYCVICGKYRKFEKPKISYLLEKTLVPLLFAVRRRISRDIVGLIQKYISFKNVVEENKSQECRLKDIDETWNYLSEEINRNELMSKKHKKVCATLNYI